jgi:membrane-bound ClpP family serine protease
MHQGILDFREESGKPVVVSMDETAASGGYYIATAADSIVANPGRSPGPWASSPPYSTTRRPRRSWESSRRP